MSAIGWLIIGGIVILLLLVLSKGKEYATGLIDKIPFIGNSSIDTSEYPQIDQGKEFLEKDFTPPTFPTWVWVVILIVGIWFVRKIL